MPETESDTADIFTEMLRMQSEAARQLVAASMPSEAALAEWSEAALAEWGEAADPGCPCRGR